MGPDLAFKMPEFISHDAMLNSIYLFLRTEQGSDYFYLGTQAYLRHDKNRHRPERPVLEVGQGGDTLLAVDDLEVLAHVPAHFGRDMMQVDQRDGVAAQHRVDQTLLLCPCPDLAALVFWIGDEHFGSTQVQEVADGLGIWDGLHLIYPVVMPR